MSPPSSSELNIAPDIGTHASRHLFSTFVFTAWVLFIIITLVVHEIAHRATWKPLRAVAERDIPWIYRPGSRLPSILRTVFSQAHGPIMTMHLARLAVGALDLSFSSPKTWMEVFWLADRRWAGPFGVGRTGWTIISHRLRVSFSLILLAALSIVALVTPVVMTRAYSVVTGEIRWLMRTEVNMVDLPTLARLSRRDQLSENELWSKGVPVDAIFPANAYDSGYAADDTRSWKFFTGDSNTASMSLTGIAVRGRCDSFQYTLLEFEDMCRISPVPCWDFDTKLSSFSIGPVNFSITGGSILSNSGLTMPFGQLAAMPSQLQQSKGFTLSDTDLDAIFLFRSSIGEFTISCQGTALPGIASVNGRNKSVDQFTYTPHRFDESIPPEDMPLHPLAAVMQTDWTSFQHSINLQLERLFRISGDYEYTCQKITAYALWDGVLAMSAGMWIESAVAVEMPGNRKIVTTGIRREDIAFCALITLLGIWFLGMVATTATLLRPAWTGTLDGYAVARMLQYQPVISATSEVWFAELEGNQHLLQRFKMHRWRSPEI